jgi:hypothetical protein
MLIDALVSLSLSLSLFHSLSLSFTLSLSLSHSHSLSLSVSLSLSLTLSHSLSLSLCLTLSLTLSLFLSLSLSLSPILLLSLTLSITPTRTEGARTAKMAGASQECQIVLFTDSIFTVPKNATKTDIIYTDLENKEFVSVLESIKGDELLLAKVRVRVGVGDRVWNGLGLGL